MIQVKKDNSNIPEDYIILTTNLRIRRVDLDSGENLARSGRELFEELKSQPAFHVFKEKLILDQGYICCYCNCRVQLKGSTVEHVIPISSVKSLLSEYENLLISCNETREVRRVNKTYPEHCDASKGNQLLDFSPLDVRCWSDFNYSLVDGSISVLSPEAQQVVDVLQLDCDVLRANRLAELTILYDDSGQLISYEELEMVWDSCWKRDMYAMSKPYFFVIVQNIYFLV
jgi:uncharacterized protein (TIGR02646 family)